MSSDFPFYSLAFLQKLLTESLDAKTFDDDYPVFCISTHLPKASKLIYPVHSGFAAIFRSQSSDLWLKMSAFAIPTVHLSDPQGVRHFRK